MFIVESITAREILDSRGNPTIEVDLTLKGGVACGRGAIPSGASTGSREALELRDGDKKRFLGRGVLKAVENVQKIIAPQVIHKTFKSLAEFDEMLLELDGTLNKSKLGANAILGASMAFCRAIAVSQKLSLYELIAKIQGNDSFVLPVPLMNIFNGGLHGNNGLDFQEFMIVPVGTTFKETLRMGVEVFHHLKSILHQERLSTSVGDEGGFACSLDQYPKKHEQVLDFIMQAIKNAGYQAGKDIFIALDSAASEFFDNGSYFFENKKRIPSEMIQIYEKLINQYPIISIEDGLAEGDWDGWKALTTKLGKKCQLIGDDIFVTNSKILQEGIQAKIANAILVKINQIGTITETLQTVKLAQEAGYHVIISHRSGETEDTFISDLAVGTASGQIKTGSACRSDRMAKYNQLLRIEEQLLQKHRRVSFKGIQSFK